jgi:hypothetical protein
MIEYDDKKWVENFQMNKITLFGVVWKTPSQGFNNLLGSLMELLQFFCPCFEFELKISKCENEFSKGLAQ